MCVCLVRPASLATPLHRPCVRKASSRRGFSHTPALQTERLRIEQDQTRLWLSFLPTSQYSPDFCHQGPELVYCNAAVRPPPYPCGPQYRVVFGVGFSCLFPHVRSLRGALAPSLDHLFPFSFFLPPPFLFSSFSFYLWGREGGGRRGGRMSPVTDSSVSAAASAGTGSRDGRARPSSPTFGLKSDVRGNQARCSAEVTSPGALPRPARRAGTTKHSEAKPGRRTGASKSARDSHVRCAKVSKSLVRTLSLSR